MKQIKMVAVAVVIWSAVLHCYAAIDTAQVATNIIQIVGQTVTNVDKTKLTEAAWEIAGKISSNPADFTSLEANLEQSFQNKDYAFLDWNDNSEALKTAATNIAARVDLGYASPSLELLLTKPKPSSADKWLLALSSGAEFLNPYNVAVPHGATKESFGTLTNAGSSTVGYLQLDLLRRDVLAPDKLPDNSCWCDGFIWNQWPPTPDLEIQLGFLFDNSLSSPSNNTYSAQSLAGSDIYMKFGTGIPIFRNNWQSEDPVSAQLSIGAEWGVTTSQSFEMVHFSQFYGGIADFGIPFSIWRSATNEGTTLIEAKGGIAELDFPSLVGTNNLVNLDGNGLPKFHEAWQPQIGINTFIPFGNNIYLNAEANTFLANRRPNQWNVKVGITIPFDKIPTMIKGIAGAGN